MSRVKPERMDHLEKGAAFGKPREAPMRKECSKRVALEFTRGISLAIEKLIREDHPFEYIGGNKGKAIFILSKNAAELFKNQYPFKCKELKIVSMSNLPRKKANQIRKRHKFFPIY